MRNTSSPILALIFDPNVYRARRGDDADFRSYLSRALESVADASKIYTSIDIHIHIRIKNPDEKLRLASECRLILEASGSARQKNFLNGSSEEAIRYGFEGVHWPEHQIPTVPRSGNQLGPSEPLLRFRSAAVHDSRACEIATKAGADSVVFAPVFSPRSKPGQGRGLRALRQLAASSKVPVVALGGVSSENIASCIQEGASGVASLGGLLEGPRIDLEVHKLAQALEFAYSRNPLN